MTTGVPPAPTGYARVFARISSASGDISSSAGEDGRPLQIAHIPRTQRRPTRYRTTASQHLPTRNVRPRCGQITADGLPPDRINYEDVPCTRHFAGSQVLRRSR